MAWTRRRDQATDQPAVTGNPKAPQGQHGQGQHAQTQPAQAAPHTPSPVPGLDHYTDLVAMARGGFSTVYRAHEPAFDRTVAIKVLASPLDTDRDRRRFERELRLTGRLTGHPHIVIPLASGITADNRAWVASPWYEEGSLADRLAAGPLAVPDVLRIGVGLAGALATAHQHGIVHRDVKPANVLLDAGMSPALADFGIATTMETTSTVDALTPLHAAPEVIEQQGPVSPLSDVWSLASTLWTALAGVAPFGRPQDPPLTVMMRIVRDPLPPMARTDDVPPELEALLRACLEKDPANRPAGAREVGEALAAVQSQLGRTQTRLVVNPPAASHRVLTTQPQPVAPQTQQDGESTKPPSEATTQPTYAPTLPDQAPHGTDEPATRLREQPPPEPPTRLRDHDRDHDRAQPGPDPETRLRPAQVAPTHSHGPAPEIGAESAPGPGTRPGESAALPGHDQDPDADLFEHDTLVRRGPTSENAEQEAPERTPDAGRPRWVLPVTVGAATVLAAAAGLIVLGSIVGDPDTPTPTPTVSAPPLPTGLTLTELPDGSVRLGWEDPNKGTTQYVVTLSSGGHSLPSVVAQANGVTVNGLTRGKPYCFVVTMPVGLGKWVSGPFRCINGDSLTVSTATTT